MTLEPSELIACAAPRWIAFSLGCLHVESWDGHDTAMVYEPRSGNTHLLDALPLELLHVLQKAPRTVEQLAAEFSDLIETGHEGAASTLLLQCLHRLQDMNLVSVSQH